MKRPHCGKCHSTMVYRDDDIIEGVSSIVCKKCGNSYPGGAGFYMAETARMEVNIMKQDCKNCGRYKSIVKNGLCWSCVNAVKNLPNNDDHAKERADALAAVAERARKGEIKKRGPRPGTSKTQSITPDKKSSSIHTNESAITVQSITVFFSGADVALYHKFCAACASSRRTPENHLLIMIEEEIIEFEGTKL